MNPDTSQPTRDEEKLGIVELYPGKTQTEAAVPPKLIYNNGPLLTNVEIFTIFWGNAWTQPTNQQLSKQLNQFFTTILTSSLIDELAEYNTQVFTIGHGRLIGSATITSSSPSLLTLDDTVQKLLQNEINNKTLPQPSSNTLYFVYLPPNDRVQKGLAVSCVNFCGYHDAINNKIFYAVMPFPSCSGCLGNLQPLDALTSTSSHELCEAITDSIPGTGWYDNTNGEIGDICAWKTKKVDNYTVQLEWSNKQNSCI